MKGRCPLTAEFIESLLDLTHPGPPGNPEDPHGLLKSFFVPAAGIHPVPKGLLLLLDEDGRILASGGCEDRPPVLEPLEGRSLVLSKSSRPRHESHVAEGRIHLYFLKNIFSEENAPTPSLLLACPEERPDAFPRLARLADCLETLIRQDAERHRQYLQLMDCLDAVDDGISACDAKGRLTFINTSACKMIGAVKSELIGKDLSKPPFKDTVLTQVIASGKSHMDFEYNLFYKGKRMRMMNSAYPVLDSRGRIQGAIDIFRRIQRSYKIASDMAGYTASFTFDDFIGSSTVLANKINLAKEFSNIGKTTLIEGESGTGKELFSQAIHNHSDRRDGPFVAINCANFPYDLFDSELFGYDEGAFTGARKGGKTGKFELADGGTLFLDEIGEMPMQLQAKLLRVIETKQITRLGSNKPVQIDVRIIAATNRDLETMVRKNQFREDLYYRLKVLYLKLPPLRERGRDIRELCLHFIDKINPDLDKPVEGLSPKALDLIRSHPWPGNIRQLENTLAIAMYLCGGGTLEPGHLIRAGLDAPQVPGPAPENMETLQRELLEKTLKAHGYNIRKTAASLGVSRNTVYRKMKRYGIERRP